jgi:aspartate/methionine/tyrosine aminotransferase
MIPEQTLAEVVRIAKERSIYVLCDEVYRPLFHSLEAGEREPPSLLSMAYERTIVTGSMSKAYALAGIRVGWIASRSRAVIEACAAARDYTTISVSQIDDGIAAFALGDQCVNKLLGRNIALAKTNRALLEEFMLDHAQMCSWIRPGAGTTAFIRFSRDGRPVDDVALCELLMRKLGLLVVPGSKCFGQEFQGYVRIGYLSETEVLQAGLAVLREFMKQEFLTVPLV